jgi:Prephenate dehydratase
VIVAVAYPGPPGSHASAAAAVLFPADDLVPLTGFRAVADSVSAVDTTHGVLPIESSLAGPVAETHDLLHDHALSIVAEAVLPIRHCLAAPQQVPLEEIRIVHSHPMALEQCRGCSHGCRTPACSRCRRRRRRRSPSPRRAIRRTLRSPAPRP